MNSKKEVPFLYTKSVTFLQVPEWKSCSNKSSAKYNVLITLLKRNNEEKKNVHREREEYDLARR